MPTENRSSNTALAAQNPQGRRERFQKWVLATKHPVLGYLDGTWLARGDDREGYADKYVQGLWVAFKEFAKPAPQPHPEPIAWMVGTAFWWAKEEAERDAEAMGLPVISVGPIGDIELAREMLRRADRREGKWARLCAGRNNQIAELRAQLAEAQEVLRDCIEVGELNAETEWKALRVSKGRRLYVDDRALSALEVQP
ncbi:hypothetical protein LU640_29330 [Pseudomonas monteilii]|uniref:hypothetical protein n=1 Tax=Pseudomonas monteilii TaxID=76759 RepID=UPI001E4E5BCB|nr:hypothetical protein [Pseudomonas monteilii]MCE1020542.1 hypothetical protein [Pseudomonas monteilii]MCE1037890.1 hypothetical protein [Pseudomonas monteilii]MCE1090718.1 hypothetical protein [Pseudomonas monteilii]